MATLTTGTIAIKDGNATLSTNNAVANDGTNNFPAVAVRGNDGTLYMPAMATAATAGFVQVTDGTTAAGIGHGTAANALRVELPTDGTGKVGLNAGVAKIGVVTTDQTTHGTSDLVASDITKVNGAAVAVGHGVAATALRVELPTDGTGIVGQGAAAAATAPWFVAEVPTTSGGLTATTVLSAGAILAANIKASAGQFYGLQFTNSGASPVYVRIYNNVNTPPGTGDTVFMRFLIPGNTAGAGFVAYFPAGVACSTGIGYRVTAAVGDTDATTLSGTTVQGNFLTK